MLCGTGWVDEMKAGDIIVAERNFGMGSSRPAARNLALLGVGCLVADNINGLFLPKFSKLWSASNGM